MVRVAPTFDIDSDYQPIHQAQKTTPSAQPAKKITLEELPSLQVNQKVNVTASVSLGNEKPKPVQLKTSKEMTSVILDHVLEDETGTATIPVWDPLNKLSIYITCQACRQKIIVISQQKSLKCKNCGVPQRQADCKRDASVQLLIHLDDKNVWLRAFTDVLESLFSTHPTISLLGDSDTVEELLMDTKDIEFTYNMNRKLITKISSSLITG